MGYGSGAAFGLELVQFSKIGFAAAVQTGLLKLEIAEMLLAGEIGFELDDAGALIRGDVLESVGEVDVTAGEQGELKSGDALKAPFGIGDGLDQRGLTRADGLEFFGKGEDVTFVFSGAVGGKQNGASSERGFDGVQTRDGFSLFGLWPGAELRVRAVSFKLRFGHSGPFVEQFGFAGEFALLVFGGAADLSGGHGLAPEREMARDQDAWSEPERSVAWAQFETNCAW